MLDFSGLETSAGDFGMIAIAFPDADGYWEALESLTDGMPDFVDEEIILREMIRQGKWPYAISVRIHPNGRATYDGWDTLEYFEDCGYPIYTMRELRSLQVEEQEDLSDLDFDLLF